MIANRLSLRSIVVSGAVLLAVLAAGCGGGAKEVVMDVQIQGKALVPEIVTVENGTKLTLNIQTDQKGKFRVEVYDVGTTVEPGKVATISFTTFIRPPSVFGRIGALGPGQHWIVFQADGEIDEEQIGKLLVIDK